MTFQRCTLLAAAAILGWQLFLPPVVGLANNGDFHKVLGVFSLGGPIADEYKYAPAILTYHPDYFVVLAYYSTEIPLAWAAIAMNSVVSKNDAFDLRFIGLVHASLYLTALWLVLPLLRESRSFTRWICCGLILFLFGDVMYVSQLNSFYMDTPALLFCLLSVAFLCRVLRWQRTQDAVGLLLCAIFMACSKLQHAPLGLLAALLLAWKSRTFLPGFSRIGRIAAVSGLAVASILSLKSTPWSYSATPLFSQIFYGVLPRARDPLRELRILGLDDRYRKYVGMYAYAPGSPAGGEDFDREFLSKTSYARLGLLFLRRPGRVWDVLVNGLAEAGRQRPVMGNFDRGAGFPDSAESQAFSLWSRTKRMLFQGHAVRYLGYTVSLAVSFTVLLWTRRRRLPNGSFEAGLTLTGMMFAALLISILGDPIDNIRHSWVFMGLSDTMLAALVWTALPK